jgi:uncharacterized membrane protein
VRRDTYDILVVAHAVIALIGFGAIGLSGVYGRTARRRGRPGALEELRRYFARPPLAEASVLAVGVLGFAAAGTEPRGGGVAQVWTMVGAVLWLAASAVWLRVVRPAEAVLRAGLAAGDATSPVPEAVGRRIDDAGRRLSAAAATTSVLFVVALGFMVFQPG